MLNLDKEESMRIGLTMMKGCTGYTVSSVMDMVRTVPNLAVDMEQGSFVVPARCRISERAIENDDKYLFFVDSDMHIPIDTLKKLIDAIKDNPKMGAVSGHYVKRDGSFMSISNWRNRKGEWLPPKAQYKRINKYMDKEKVVPVDVFGAGCLLISVEALKKCKHPIWDSGWIMYKGELDYSTEDYFFVNRLKDAGYNPSTHFGAPAGHLGEHLFVPMKMEFE